MRVITIGRAQQGSARTPVYPVPLAVELLNGIEMLRKQQIRVYRTTSHYAHQRFVFTTTSKELHLELGRFSEEMRGNLGMLVMNETKALDGDNEVLISFMDESGEVQKGILFTVTHKSNVVNITMSPAH